MDMKRNRTTPKAVTLDPESFRAYQFLRETSKVGFNFSQFIRNSLIEYAKQQGMPSK